MISFPNQSRVFDATRRAVQFWGHESSMEWSFFVTEDALKRLQPNAPRNEAGLLLAFDGPTGFIWRRDCVCRIIIDNDGINWLVNRAIGDVDQYRALSLARALTVKNSPSSIAPVGLSLESTSSEKRAGDSAGQSYRAYAILLTERLRMACDTGRTIGCPARAHR
jgi:hypothetical protein